MALSSRARKISSQNRSCIVPLSKFSIGIEVLSIFQWLLKRANRWLVFVPVPQVGSEQQLAELVLAKAPVAFSEVSAEQAPDFSVL